MSPELREQVTWLLDSQHRELVSAIAESRSIDEAAARELVNSSPYDDDQAVDGAVNDTPNQFFAVGPRKQRAENE